MADTIKITAEARDRAGKGAARAARRAGMIPGVIYGDNKPPVLFNVNAQSLLKVLRDPAAQRRGRHAVPANPVPGALSGDLTKREGWRP